MVPKGASCKIFFEDFWRVVNARGVPRYGLWWICRIVLPSRCFSFLLHLPLPFSFFFLLLYLIVFFLLLHLPFSGLFKQLLFHDVLSNAWIVELERIRVYSNVFSKRFADSLVCLIFWTCKEKERNIRKKNWEMGWKNAKNEANERTLCKLICWKLSIDPGRCSRSRARCK